MINYNTFIGDSHVYLSFLYSYFFDSLLLFLVIKKGRQESLSPLLSPQGFDYSFDALGV